MSLANGLLPGSREVTSRRISVAVPVHNEQDVLPQLFERLDRVLASIPGGPHEMVFVDDGSRDGSLALLEAKARADNRVVVVSLSRNFGHQTAVSAALDHVTGDAVLVIDADLQDPPESLPMLLEKFDEGFDVVYVRRVNRKEAWYKRVLYHLAYRLIAGLSEIQIPVDAGDFAVLSARVVQKLSALPERQRYLRGLRSWVGFKQAGVFVEREARAGGETKYTYAKLLRLAFDGAFAFSTVPLRLTAMVGLLAVTGSALFGLYALYVKLILHESPQGFTAVLLMLTFLGGAILISLWIVGEYVGRIYEEVKHRPLYVIDRVMRGGAPTESR